MGCGQTKQPPQKIDLSKASNVGPASGDRPAEKEKKKKKRNKGGEPDASTLSMSETQPAKKGRGGGKSRNQDGGGSDTESMPQGTGKRKKKKDKGDGRNDEAAPDTHEEPDLPGRAKYMPVPVVNEARGPTQGQYFISCFAHISELKGLTVAVREPDGCVHAIEYTDQELTELREKRQLKHNWASFFKALCSAFTKGNPKVRKQGGSISLDIILSSTKEPKHQQFPLDLKKLGNAAGLTAKYFLEPFQKHFSRNHDKANDATWEKKYCRAESAAEANQHRADESERVARDARKQKDELSANHSRLQHQITTVQRSVSQLKSGTKQRNFLDSLYVLGGARVFNGHTPFATPNDPREQLPNKYACALIQTKFPLERDGMSDADMSKALSERPSDPQLKQLLDNAPDERHWQIMKTFERVDRWDFDVFALADSTDNTPLFHTAFCLLHKYDLVRHFGLSIEITLRFLAAAQAGYRPNPYHNATHAADVLHVTHYVLGPGGLARMLRLTREDLLAAVIAATVHDYDHPGFNNNFHTRTGGYLATLYNDRSILENHHCASIFEMMNTSTYDMLKPLSEDQRKDVRDAIVDMLLSTDMGNHAKIFSAFRRRLNESDDWVSRKEDVRLALVMAIKMADISNCGRPRKLYLQWAKNIATEFYAQGDAELKLGLSVSPFMDRRKDRTDFSKGQISFINFIVVPLFEAMAELLPSLEFAVKICQENKDHWAKDTDGSGAV